MFSPLNPVFPVEQQQVLCLCTQIFPLTEIPSLSASELVYELAEFLSRRYPKVYSCTRHPPRENDYGWYKEGQIKEITMIPLGATYNLDVEDPMKVSALLWVPPNASGCDLHKHPSIFSN